MARLAAAVRIKVDDRPLTIHSFRYHHPTSRRYMQLVVVTPGVPMASARQSKSTTTDGFWIHVRARRCGRLPVDPVEYTHVRLLVRCCAVSIHAADRIVSELSTAAVSYEICVIHAMTVPPWLQHRFRCPIRCCHPRSASYRPAMRSPVGHDQMTPTRTIETDSDSSND